MNFNDTDVIQKSLFDSLSLGMSYNNRSRADKVDGKWKRVGEPTEVALLVLAEKMQGGS